MFETETVGPCLGRNLRGGAWHAAPPPEATPLLLDIKTAWIYP